MRSATTTARAKLSRSHGSAGPSRRQLRLLVATCLLLIVAGGGGAQADIVSVQGVIFHDLDASGIRDAGEPGLAGVMVTNGIDVVPSAPDGAFTVEVDRAVSRFVIMTVPRGYRATDSFFQRLDASPSQTVAFGLLADPSQDQQELRFVHASDPQVVNLETQDELAEALDEIGQLSTPARFVVITGDLVHTANESQFESVAGGLGDSPVPVYPAFGDHDADPDSLQVRSYERWFGPTCYAFDYGPYHFVIYNDVRSVSADGSFPQVDWLAADLAGATGTVLLFTHYLPDRDALEQYRSLGVHAVFSGHWHANRTRRIDGLQDFNTAPLRYAGIDRSDRGFRIVDIDQDSIRTEVRTGGVQAHLEIVQPTSAQAVPFGELQLRAVAYDSRHPDLELAFRIDGPGGAVWQGALVSAGGWSYVPDGEPASLPSGEYALSIEASAGGRLLASESVDFTVESVALPTRVAGEPWPGFRGDPQGSGVASGELVLPLQLAWAVHAGGPTGLSSPVMEDGRIFIAHAAHGEVAPAVVGIDAGSGALLWRHASAGVVKGTPAVGEGRVVVMTADGVVEALDPATGTLLWSVGLGDPAERFDVTSPTIVDGVVYVGGGSVSAALRLTDGSELWRAQPAYSDWLATIYSAPAIDDSYVALALYSGLHVLDRSTGASVWTRAERNRECHRSAALIDGIIYAAGDGFGSQLLRALDAANGAELWSAPFPVGNANSAPAITPDAVVLGTSNGRVQAFDRSTGAEVWRYYIGEPIACGAPYQRTVSTVTASPLLVGSTILVGADDGRLHAIGAATGDGLWAYDLGVPIRSTAAMSGNQVWVATTDGTLVSFVAGPPSEVGIEEPVEVPAMVTRLGAVQPNPMPGVGWIPFSIGLAGARIDAGAGAASGAHGSASVAVTLRVFDVAGRHVTTLIDGPLAWGEHRVRWDGRSAQGRRMATGVYFLRLEAGGKSVQDRVTLVR